MAQEILYTPIVKGKENEFKAIGKMPRNLAAKTLPLVELLAPNEASKFDASYQRFAANLRKYCPSQQVSVDLHSISPTQLTSDGSLGLEALCGELSGLRIEYIPVYGFDHEPELWDRIVKIARRLGRGLTIRITKEDLAAPEDTRDELLDRLGYADIGASAVNVLIDNASLESLDAVGLTRAQALAVDFTDLLMTASDFRLVSVVGSSMPKDVSNVPIELSVNHDITRGRLEPSKRR